MDYFDAKKSNKKAAKKVKKAKKDKLGKRSKKKSYSGDRKDPSHGSTSHSDLMEQAMRLQKKLSGSSEQISAPVGSSAARTGELPSLPGRRSAAGARGRESSSSRESASTGAGADEPPISSAAAGGGGGSSRSSATSSSSSSESSGKASPPPASKSFAELGLCEPLVQACTALGWKSPTPIQQEAIPHVLSGRDVVGLAETGSGKTAAFSLPMLQALLAAPQRFFGLVLAPTRELALQIHDQVSRLGQGIGLSVVALVGGVDLMTQSIALARRPHIVVGTPGRVADHLENTKGFTASRLRFMVLDEADRMLSLDFEEALDKILAAAPSDRRTLLFSATITTQVARLQRASLRNPVKVEVSSSQYQTVGKLTQEYIFVPAKTKDAHLVAVLAERRACSAIVFVATCALAQRAAGFLRVLGFPVACLHGQMSQPRRLQQLHDFRSGNKKVLVATDVASRGLDIPQVDLVINHDVPASGKDYVHRVGRTARAGRSGRAITVVTQYDVEQYRGIEAALGKKLTEYPKDDAAAAAFLPRVEEASRQAQAVARDAREALAQALDDGDGLGGEGGGPGRKRGRGAVPSKKERRREKMLAAAAEAAEFGTSTDGGDAGAAELAESRKRRRTMVAAAMTDAGGR